MEHETCLKDHVMGPGVLKPNCSTCTVTEIQRASKMWLLFRIPRNHPIVPIPSSEVSPTPQ